MEKLSEILPVVQNEISTLAKISKLPKYNPKEVREVFMQVLNILVAKKSNNTKSFVLTNENKIIIDIVCSYYNNELERLKSYKIDIHKGLLIMGNYGSGKSLILEAYQIIKKQYDKVSVNMKKAGFFNEVYMKKDIYTNDIGGVLALEKYWKVNEIIIDDIGDEEANVKIFGNDFRPVSCILQRRHERGNLTHITTNLTMYELESYYGGRIESRLNEMCNILKLGASSDSIDYRKI